MKILHLIAGSLAGGAARGAYWLHQGLCGQNIDSSILTNSRDTLQDKRITTIATTKTKAVQALLTTELDRLPPKIYPHYNKQLFSSGYASSAFLKHPAVKAADILHLHWINGFVNIKYLQRLQKPIIWTLRDMWPLTGGCHYALACKRYEQECGKCPVLGSSREKDLAYFLQQRKKKLMPTNLHLVAISSWLAACAEKSKILSGYPIQVIPNCVDVNVFKPIEKQQARQLLGLPEQEKIILAGAQNSKDAYKGFDVLLQALQKLPKTEKYTLVFFGKVDAEIVKQHVPHFINLGFLQDVLSLRVAYSAADVFVASSLQEAFGKTLIEAMACATPVVCFDATGPKDIITHQYNGYAATPFAPESFAQGIEWVLNHSNPIALQQAAVQTVQQKFSSAVVAKQYKTLYEAVLEKQQDKAVQAAI